MASPVKGRRVGGGPAHERHILASLATSLFEHDSITTTEAKAKRLRPLVERLITFAKRGDLHARRRVLTVVRDKGVVHRLFAEIAPDMAAREGGYTRVTRIGARKGDRAPMVVIELVRDPRSAETATVKEAEAAPKREAKKAEKAEAADTDAADLTLTEAGPSVDTARRRVITGGPSVGDDAWLTFARALSKGGEGTLFLRGSVTPRLRNEVEAALVSLGERVGVQVQLGEGRSGSWWRSFKAIPSEDEVHVPDGLESEAVANCAEAISKLANASASVNHAFFMVKSLLFVKSTDESGETVSAARMLTAIELKAFETGDLQALLADPVQALRFIHGQSAVGRHTSGIERRSTAITRGPLETDD